MVACTEQSTLPRRLSLSWSQGLVSQHSQAVLEVNARAGHRLFETEDAGREPFMEGDPSRFKTAICTAQGPSQCSRID